MDKKSLNAAQLKWIALSAMTVDHLAWALVPGYPKTPLLLLLHLLGRLAAPVFWFFVAEGYHYTRDLRRYGLRLLAFAAVSHFAYRFAFGISLPLTPFNQTSVIWPLFLGLLALAVNDSARWKPWQKIGITIALTVLAFPADWSSIAVLAVLEIGTHRGRFKRQMLGMMGAVAVYAVVYARFIDPVYGVLQLGTALAIPLLAKYNGKPGAKRLKWLFYLYYPLHLAVCGLIRAALHGNAAGMAGAA